MKLFKEVIKNNLKMIIFYVLIGIAINFLDLYSITYYQQEDVPARVGDVYLTYEAGTGRGGQGAPALPTLPDTAMNSFLGWSLYPNDDTLYTIGSEYCTDVELYAVYAAEMSILQVRTYNFVRCSNRSIFQCLYCPKHHNMGLAQK